jgi:hydrogenase nickel incorporation protein HypB
MNDPAKSTRIPIVERVLEANDQLAESVRADLERRAIFAVDIIGAPGSGKTALLEATLRALKGRRHPAVLVGDLATRRDGDRLALLCDQVVQISTGQGCHLEAGQVRDALAQVDLSQVDLLLIENVGNLICPVGFDLGQAAKVGVFAVTDGDDKAAKHPYLVQAADVLLLNKIDLLPYVPFDRSVFEADVRLLNPTVPILEISAATGAGLDAWLDWLEGPPADRGSTNPSA